jgi:hypothetical protein
VDFVKLLLDKLMRLHRKYADTPLSAQFPRPAFKVRHRTALAAAFVRQQQTAAGS